MSENYIYINAQGFLLYFPITVFDSTAYELETTRTSIDNVEQVVTKLAKEYNVTKVFVLGDMLPDFENTDLIIEKVRAEDFE